MEDASFPLDFFMVPYQLTFFLKPTPLLLFSEAPPRDLIVSHQVVVDVTPLNALVAITGAKATL